MFFCSGTMHGTPLLLSARLEHHLFRLAQMRRSFAAISPVTMADKIGTDLFSSLRLASLQMNRKQAKWPHVFF